MDFGRVNLEGEGNGITSKDGSSNADTSYNRNGHGSGFLKRERSASADENRRGSKMARTDDFGGSKTMPHHEEGATLLRSNSVLSGDAAAQTMLSFSSPAKTEVTFLSAAANGGARATQSPAFLFYQQQQQLQLQQAHASFSPVNAGYGNGGLNAAMQVPVARFRGQFTSSQYMELELQARIYKYIVANVPIPSNLLIPLKRSLNPFSLSASHVGSCAPNSFGWSPFHLGSSGNADPEPGRCRRTDGKKWRCAKDAVADQKYCERHVNRGRHRSRKPVEGHSGHAVAGSTSSKVAPIASIPSASVISCNGASNSAGATSQPISAAIYSADALVNGMQASQGFSIPSPTINLKSEESPFSIPRQNVSFGESLLSQSEFVSSNSYLNSSLKMPRINNSKNTSSFLGLNERETDDRHPLRHFIDDWPKDESSNDTVAWPEELKSDWTQLSMSIPMASDFSSSSNSPHPQENLALSPLRLCREFEPISNSDHNNKQTNWIPISWGNAVGGPLGEVLNSTTNSGGGGSDKNSSSSLNLMTEMWDGSHSRSPQLGSSPTGVLQKATTFASLSNSSSGSSPTAEHKKTLDAVSLYDDVLGSTLASCSSIPSL